MNDKIKMSSGLLDLLAMVHAYKKYLTSELMFRETHGLEPEKDWYTKTEKFYNSIDNSILNQYGLCKNKVSFKVVVNFIITPEILSTEYDKLDKFECWNSCIPEY